MDLEVRIENLKQEIKEKQNLLAELEEKLTEYKNQQERRKQYMSSKEIIDYVENRSGKLINMSTIKRWTDEGYLGEVIDEREHFWALKTKQGKKRNLYRKSTVLSFLYNRGYIAPYYNVLDEVLYSTENASFSAVVIDVRMENGQFLYKIQLQDYTIIDNIDEKQLKGAENDGEY
ncbi:MULTISPECIES: hypothetical protein [Aneurinibacillus]|jgi:predicted transcriptional regulator|uniref:Uncharacterized protein n=1 Tax=Aneurinibacillus danicus TaxID=267746 RepID=A0A511V1K1_9BACL|nr:MULTISPECIES: hypothetical protein [Aneurinibacillus]GEN32786.1 hypothetical protein ADA01nite_02460 [Aneurinibacillus danicus]